MISIYTSMLLIILSYLFLLGKYDNKEKKTLTFFFLVLLVSPLQFLPVHPTDRSYVITCMYTIIFFALFLFVYISEKIKKLNNTYKNLLAIISALSSVFASRLILKIFGVIE
ncbi:hypothetical protein DVL30_21835 [Salmonella enterica]|nr:hypothetical protein [Salmonella enterica]